MSTGRMSKRLFADKANVPLNPKCEYCDALLVYESDNGSCPSCGMPQPLYGADESANTPPAGWFARLRRKWWVSRIERAELLLADREHHYGIFGHHFGTSPSERLHMERGIESARKWVEEVKRRAAG